MAPRKISTKSQPMGPAKLIRTPRNFINKRKMKPKIGQQRDYLKNELRPIEENAGFGFGQTGMDAED